MSEFKPVRGMRDFLPAQAEMLRSVEGKARRVAELYGYKEIVTPVVESYDLLSAKAGEEVKSRMFLFKDLGGRDVALRPEFTASVARLVATTLRNEPKPLRLFCVGSIYRYDEPQRGRYREFWQSNYELMGSNRPEADAEVLMLTDALMHQAGLKKYAFKVGHVGVLRGILSQEKVEEKIQNAVMQLMDKKQYDDAIALLEKSGTPRKCTSLIRKLVELRGANVLEVAYSIKTLVEDYERSVEAVENLREVLELVSGSGCEIDMTVEAGFARGLEYYTGMIFEINVPDLDIALGGGGRYDRLIELFGGEPTPAVGVAHGLDRIMLGLETHKTLERSEERKTVMVVPTKDELSGQALRVAQLLRVAGIPAELEVMRRRMVKALEMADKKKTTFAVIVGEKELGEGAVVIRNLSKREQNTIRIERIAEYLKCHA
jgi:histidyl-tRNA synthetase